MDTTGAGDAFGRAGPLDRERVDSRSCLARRCGSGIDVRQKARRPGLLPDGRGSGVGQTAAGAALSHKVWGLATAVGRRGACGRYRSGGQIRGVWFRRRHWMLARPWTIVSNSS